jgi:type I restriction enzyme S subunit
VNKKQNDLPKGWAWVDLVEITKDALIGLDRGRSQQTNIPSGCPYIKMNNVTMDGRVLTADVVYVQASPEEKTKFRLQEGDLLFNTRNSKELVGKVGVVRTSLPNSIFNNNLMRIRFSHGINSRFLCAQMCGPEFRRRMESVKNATTNVAAIYAKNLFTLAIALPPFTEQQRIVEEIEKQFTRLDAAVAALKRVQANLKRYRASVLKAACEGKLVPTEAELARAEGRDYESADRLLERILKERRAKWEADQLAKMRIERKTSMDSTWKDKYREPAPPDISAVRDLPVGWAWASLETVADIIDPNPSHRMPIYTEEGIPFISSENFCKPDGIDFSVSKKVADKTYTEQAARFTINNGDFVLSRIGTIGKTRFLPLGTKYCLSHALVVIKAFSEHIDKRFLRTVISSDALTKQAKHGVQSVGVPDLGMAKIRSFRIPIMSLSEQRRIVAEVERRLSVVDEIGSIVEANLKRAAALRQSILKRAFEGKLVPQDPDDEPASILLEHIRAERASKQAETKPAKPTRAKRKGQEGKQGQLPLVSKATGTEGD